MSLNKILADEGVPKGTKKPIETASGILILIEENKDDERPAVKEVTKFLKKYGKACRQKLIKHPDDQIWNGMRYALIEAAVFLTDFYLVRQTPDARAFETATVGDSLGSVRCTLSLSYMYAKGVCGLTFNAKSARTYIERAVRAGGAEDDNFEIVKDAVIDAEERAARIRQSAIAGAKRSGEFLELTLGFSQWLSDYTSRETPPEPVEGTVVVEKTIGGDQYVFYAKDDYGRTRGERMKNYDSALGRGETESGTMVKKK